MSESKDFAWPGWKTVGKIGSGSFGSVYEIERQLLDKTEKAAVKVVSIPQNENEIEDLVSMGFDEESITQRYRGFLNDIVNEYNIMLEVKGNTNIVYVDDLRIIQHDDGIGWDIYIKMELLTPLMKYLPINITEELAIRLGIDMCHALELCERNSIVHRDIKPQNIFVSKDGNFKLGDFGIAKTIEQTIAGTKAGTFKYMSPEIYHGQPTGHRADIYSLGLVLYWLLNERRLPFVPLGNKVPTAEEEQGAQARRMNGEKMPEPAHGSRELQFITLKACAFDPNDRYQNAEEMLYDLTHLDELENKLNRKRNKRNKDDIATKKQNRIQAVDSQEEMSLEMSGRDDPFSELENDTSEPVGRENNAQLAGIAKKKRGKWIIPIIAAAAIIVAFAIIRNRGLNKETSSVPEQPIITEAQTIFDNPIIEEPTQADILSANQTAWDAIREVCDECPEFSVHTYIDTAVVANMPDNALALRKGPSTDSQQIDALRNGTQVLVYSRNGQWSFVNYDGVWGWCCSDYLVITGSNEEFDFSCFELATIDPHTSLGLSYTSWEESGLKDYEIVWSDDALETAMREVLGIEDRGIMLSDVWVLTFLDLRGKGIVDVSSLSQLRNLQIIWLNNNEISDITPLSQLTNLTHLDISSNELTDVNALTSLNNLCDLRLDNNSVSDLTGIGKMSALEVLYLDGNGIDDISDLNGLKNLRALTLNRNSISDISALTNAKFLIHLHLNENKIASIESLSSLSDLRCLSFTDNAISDLTPLSALQDLSKLFLDKNEISDIAPLSSLAKLFELRLDDNRIVDISNLCDLTHLTKLRLSGNQIQDISPLKGLTELEYLEFDWNNVSDISPLQSLTKISVLYADTNNIYDISALGNLTNLKELYINMNRIVDISPLNDLSELEILFISGNYLSDSEILAFHNTHPDICIDNTFFLDIQDETAGDVDFRYYDTVEIESAESTSDWSKEEEGGQYARYAIAGTLEESWQEGVKGPGVGESITLHYAQPVYISLLRLYPGYVCGADDEDAFTFNRNNRPLKFGITFSNGLTYNVWLSHYEFEDAVHGVVVDFGIPIRTESVTITLLAVEEGETGDTPITEIETFILREEPLEEIPDGWQKHGNSCYYYVGGEMLTGWHTIDGEDYYFHNNGRLEKDVEN